MVILDTPTGENCTTIGPASSNNLYEPEDGLQ